MDSIQNNTDKKDMLEKVQDIASINGLEYEVSGNVLNLKLGRAAGKVTITLRVHTSTTAMNMLLVFPVSFSSLFRSILCIRQTNKYGLATSQV
ncbi:hypothetical protein L8S13_07860 [Vibrio lentus]|nr:hypothetical protein [Vibrio lentus]MDH5926203.1 hypothetical protein [Vibrio lentus]